MVHRFLKYGLASGYNGLIILCFAVGFIWNPVNAQNPEQLYRVNLKDGTFYVGIITEKVPDDHIIVFTLGGNETRIDFETIKQIEETEDAATAAIYSYLAKEKREWKQQYLTNGCRYKGYFSLIQYVTGYAHWGVSSVHGYKLNQYFHVGLGVGFDGVLKPIAFRPKRFSQKSGNSYGLHIPVFAYIGGDILKKRRSPYYGLEIGYNYVIPHNTLLDLETRKISPHALSVAPSFGVKFNSSKRYHTNVGLKLTYRARQMLFRELIYDEESNLYHLEFNKVITSSWFLGLTVVQGF